MGEILQQTESNLAFYLDGKLKVNDIQTLNKWTNDLIKDEWSMVERGIKTTMQAREIVTMILGVADEYRSKLMEA